MNVAEQIARTLSGAGIGRVYGIPGEDHLILLDALARNDVEYCPAFNESSAVIMAATEAQLTGRPGVAVLSLAPGVSNGVNGLLDAYLEEIPLILISGQHAARRLPFVVRQGFDIEKLVTPLTKWQARVAVGMDVVGLIGKAIDEAMSGRPGPVYLELPDEVANSESSCDDAHLSRALARIEKRLTQTVTSPLDTGALVELADRLASSRRPVLVIGGRRRRVSRGSIETFARAYRVPVFATSRQKGIVHSGFPFFAGTFLNGNIERSVLGRSDLVIMVDPEPFDFYNTSWCFDAEAVAIVGADFRDWINPFADTIVADPDAMLLALAERNLGALSEWSTADVVEYRDSLRTTLLSTDETQFSVAQAVAAALDAWPADGYIVADAGFSKPMAAMLSDPTHPDRFLASNALSTMGYSIPAALSVRHLRDEPVLAFLGDGSLFMRATELMAPARSSGSLVLVAMMDRSLTQIEVKQERRKLQTVGVGLPALQCSDLAAALRIEGSDVTTADELRSAVSKALARGEPVLIGAHVDPEPSRQLFELLRG